MIGYLTGNLLFLEEGKVIIDVSGVGYDVFISSKDSILLHDKINQKVQFFIATIVREDSITLFGFSQKEDQKWFGILCKVKGVGHKMALKIIGQVSIIDLIYAIKNADKSIFHNVSGIGPKLALRITTELKDVVKKFDDVEVGDINKMNSNKFNKISNDAILALENLGYKKANIVKIVTEELRHKPEMSLETLITQALRKL
ncbi:Holliday junction branch migration protein RuvA [Flavobacteriaceae bacterium]|nr:Holliday junction branch migration protein RuvA [Flavobacteriaceae bacterium]